MNRGQTDKLNSFIKSFDVLTDNAAALVSVTQIAAGRIALKATIDALTTAAGLGSLDLTGYTLDKNNKREALTTLLNKVCRAAAAYYNSVGNMGSINKVNFTASELKNTRDTDLYSLVKVAHTQILPDAANLIGATAADLTALNAANEVYAEHSAKDPFFKKVFDDMRGFQRDQILWNRISELVFTQDMASLKI